MNEPTKWGFCVITGLILGLIIPGPLGSIFLFFGGVAGGILISSEG